MSAREGRVEAVARAGSTAILDSAPGVSPDSARPRVAWAEPTMLSEPARIASASQRSAALARDARGEAGARIDVGRSNGEELESVSDDSPDSEGDLPRVLASRLRIRTYPSESTSNHQMQHLCPRRIRFARTNPWRYSALSVQHVTTPGNGGRVVVAMNTPCFGRISVLSAESSSAQQSVLPDSGQADAPAPRPPIRLVHSASGGTRQRTSARSSLRKPLSREAIRALLREYHQHGNLHARDRVIQQYMPLVKSLARRHSNRGEQYEDLVQVGAVGLIKAVDRFDVERSRRLRRLRDPDGRRRDQALPSGSSLADPASRAASRSCAPACAPARPSSRRSWSARRRSPRSHSTRAWASPRSRRRSLSNGSNRRSRFRSGPRAIATTATARSQACSTAGSSSGSSGRSSQPASACSPRESGGCFTYGSSRG